MKWFSIEFFVRLVSKWIRFKSEWHHNKERREEEIIKKEGIERNPAKIEHFVRIVYYRIRFHSDVVLLLLDFFLLLFLYVVQKLNVQNGINKAKTNTQTNKYKNQLHLQYLCIIAIYTTHCRPFMQRFFVCCCCRHRRCCCCCCAACCMNFFPLTFIQFCLYFFSA